MSDHVVEQKTYFLIFGTLIVLTAITVGVAFFDFGVFNDVIALSIAVTKALLVILWFMHVKYSSRLTWAFVAAGFFWLALMLTLTATDYFSRSWQYNPQPWTASSSPPTPSSGH